MVRHRETGMHAIIRMTAEGPFGLWLEAAAVGLAIVAAPFLAAVWPEE